MKFQTLILLIGAACVSNVETHSLATAVEATKAPCVYLDETPAELEYQMEMFSRTLDPRHWTNVNNVAKAMKDAGKKPEIYVHTWELYDKSFSFPRVRRYQMVQDNMDMLEHFQDNLNQNLSNN